MKQVTPLQFALLLTATATAPAAMADIKLSFELISADGVGQLVVAQQGNKVRIDRQLPDEDPMYVLFDAKSRQYWIVEPSSESVEVKSEQQLRADQQTPTGQVKARWTGEKTKVAGINCAWAELDFKDLLKYQLCFADASALGVSADELNALNDALTFDDSMRLDMEKLGLSGVPIASQADDEEVEKLLLKSRGKPDAGTSFTPPPTSDMDN